MGVDVGKISLVDAITLRSEVFFLELYLAHPSGRVDGYGHGRSGARLLVMMRRARGVRLSPGFGFQLGFLAALELELEPEAVPSPGPSSTPVQIRVWLTGSER